MADEQRELRDLLESTQAELGQARGRLKVLEEQSTDALEDRIDALEDENVAMRARLEQGDAVRENWANRQSHLERELSIARTEQQRLQSRLETIALEQRLAARTDGSSWRTFVAAIGIGTGAALALIGVTLLMIWLGT